MATRQERWDQFSRLCVAGLLVLAPAWVASILEPPFGGAWRLGAWLSGASVVLVPLVQVFLALRAFQVQLAYARIAAVVGGLGVYCLAWALLALPPTWPVVFLGSPILAGAASGQVVATMIARFWPRIAVVPAVPIVGGAILGLVLLYLFFQWGIDALWTDGLYILPYAFSLWSVAACAAFLVLYLGRRSRGRSGPGDRNA